MLSADEVLLKFFLIAKHFVSDNAIQNAVCGRSPAHIFSNHFVSDNAIQNAECGQSPAQIFFTHKNTLFNTI